MHAESLRAQLEELTEHELAVLHWKARWLGQARPKQLPPDTTHPNWTTWGICSGRGFGKTLAGANWLGLEAAQHPGSYNAVVAPTYQDARYTCFEGPTGLLSVMPSVLWRPEDYSRSVPAMELWNGALIRGFAADSPDRLRGPQHHRAWAEEIAAWLYAEDAWSNMQFGLRLGPRPQVCWTTTPRPTAFMRQRMAQPDAVIVSGALHENAANLPQSLINEIEQYRGTKIWEQEALGRLIDPEEGGVVRRTQWRIWPKADPLPPFLFIVLSLDTAFTEATVNRRTRDPDYTACSVWGVFEQMSSANQHRTAVKLRHVMLLDCWQDRLGFPDLVARVKKERTYTYGEPHITPLLASSFTQPYIARQDIVFKSPTKGRPIDMLAIEDKGSGISLRQALAQEGILAHAYNPGRADKLARLHLVSPLFAHGRVWVVESDHLPGRPKSWAEPLVSQVCSYTGEGSIAHDDLLDCTTAALRIIKDQWMPAFSVLNAPASEDAEGRVPRQRSANPYAQ